MADLIIIPATMEGLRTLKDKSCTITLHTQELTPEQGGKLMGAMQSYGYFAWKAEGFHENERLLLDQLKADQLEGRKTYSQRLRGVLYRMWQQNPEGMTDLHHYEHYMEHLITHFKSKLQ